MEVAEHPRDAEIVLHLGPDLEAGPGRDRPEQRRFVKPYRGGAVRVEPDGVDGDRTVFQPLSIHEVDGVLVVSFGIEGRLESGRVQPAHGPRVPRIQAEPGLVDRPGRGHGQGNPASPQERQGGIAMDAGRPVRVGRKRFHPLVPEDARWIEDLEGEHRLFVLVVTAREEEALRAAAILDEGDEPSIGHARHGLADAAPGGQAVEGGLLNPESGSRGRELQVLAPDHAEGDVRIAVQEHHARPGGIIQGFQEKGASESHGRGIGIQHREPGQDSQPQDEKPGRPGQTPRGARAGVHVPYLSCGLLNHGLPQALGFPLGGPVEEVGGGSKEVLGVLEAMGEDPGVVVQSGGVAQALEKGSPGA